MKKKRVHLKRGDTVTECEGLVLHKPNGKVGIVKLSPEVPCRCLGSIVVYVLKEG